MYGYRDTVDLTDELRHTLKKSCRRTWKSSKALPDRRIQKLCACLVNEWVLSPSNSLCPPPALEGDFTVGCPEFKCMVLSLLPNKFVHVAMKTQQRCVACVVKTASPLYVVELYLPPFRIFWSSRLGLLKYSDNQYEINASFHEGFYGPQSYA